MAKAKKSKGEIIVWDIGDEPPMQEICRIMRENPTFKPFATNEDSAVVLILAQNITDARKVSKEESPDNNQIMVSVWMDEADKIRQSFGHHINH